MYIKLPYLVKTFDDTTNKMKVEEKELTVELDMSFKAHLKWEEKFQAAVGYDLNTYTTKVEKWIKNEELALANFIGIMKLLYCYINSKDLPTFSSFLGMFDIQIADKILTKLNVVIEEVRKTASKN